MPVTQQIDPPMDGPVVWFELGPFRPPFGPTTLRTTKKRDVETKKGPCDGEWVIDKGAENMRVHVSGLMSGLDLRDIKELRDAGEPFDLVSDQFSGEVYIKQVEVENTNRYLGSQRSLEYQYTIDCISSGRDETGLDDGIVTNPYDGDVPEADNPISGPDPSFEI